MANAKLIHFHEFFFFKNEEQVIGELYWCDNHSDNVLLQPSKNISPAVEKLSQNHSPFVTVPYL